MNTAYDLIALDMDGTLLNSKKEVSPGNMDAIRQALSAGKYVVLCTGRGRDELNDYPELLSSVPYGICESGSLIMDFRTDTIIHNEAIPPQYLDAIFDAAEAEDAASFVLSQGKSLLSPYYLKHIEDYLMGLYRPMYERIATLVPDVRSYWSASGCPIEKFNLYHRSAASRQRSLDRLASLPLTFSFSEESSLEISPPGVTKATGLTELCRYLKVPLSRTISIGDADNDLDVLKNAGLAIAMGNANDHVTAIAQCRVADNDHDGCREAILRYLLETV